MNFVFPLKNFFFATKPNQSIKSSAMLDKKEEQLLRISSFYPAKQLFIFCFLLRRKRKSFLRKNQIPYLCGGIPIQKHCVEIFY
jgi:hypothetical protein